MFDRLLSTRDGYLSLVSFCAIVCQNTTWNVLNAFNIVYIHICWKIIGDEVDWKKRSKVTCPLPFLRPSFVGTWHAEKQHRSSVENARFECKFYAK